MKELKEINGELCHDLLVKNTKQILAFDENADYDEWRKKVGEKFRELIGIDEIARNACEPDVEIVKTVKKDGYTQTRFTFLSEKGCRVPCYFLVPDSHKEKYPLCITLQGHSTGFHNSIGEAKDDEDHDYALTRGQFAVQAVRNGFCALAIEQRGMSMGEQAPVTPNRKWGWLCEWATMTALALGRTVIGERVWDVSRAIDVIEKCFPVADKDKIMIMGSSGGGTASYYAACIDERIGYSAPSCAFCPYEDSILLMQHCSCNYIPSQYKYFEMQDLSCLIAPRKLNIIAGEKDDIFLYDGVLKGYETAKKIYKKAGAEKNVKLTPMPYGHHFCDDIAWKSIKDDTDELGW